jgi:hypothetical protein
VWLPGLDSNQDGFQHVFAVIEQELLHRMAGRRDLNMPVGLGILGQAVGGFLRR